MMLNKDIAGLTGFATEILQKLIAIPSLSRHEHAAADYLESVFKEQRIPAGRLMNNVWAANKYFDDSLPTLLLNSHIDTVPPNKGYTLDPFTPVVRDQKLYGLGANDAGGALVSLLAAFLHFYDSELPFNIIFGASAEEEISGKNGVELLLQQIPAIDFGIVGEPTGMKMAIAQKGLMVLDGRAQGVAGHAARDEGINALYRAMEDILVLRNFRFDRVSNLLGPVHLAVTSVYTENKSHNVVPDECRFIVDVRVNERYTFQEILTLLKSVVLSELVPRSMRLKPSFIRPDHPLVRAGEAAGMEVYGSPTLSDMAFMNFPAIKSGPGISPRSHTADEFINLDEISAGIKNISD